ncbi:MAG: hypothetical protein H6599_10010 [Flavobacteriales bacterium]|nr:hypothetical protein [Flavobacteriales bacterium]
MKRVLIISIAIASMIGTSCKKGEEDPFLSLRSRKARITNEWKVYEFISNGQTINDNGGNVTTYENRFSLIDDIVTIQTTDNFGVSRDLTGIATESVWIINKDYTWERRIDYNVQDDDVITYIETTEKGNWSFVNKSISKKKKETVIFNSEEIVRIVTNVDANTGDVISTEEQNVTYPSQDETVRFDIIGLSSKEVHLNYVKEENGQYENDVYNSSSYNYDKKVYVLKKVE